jgi:hypothetical protein
MQPDEPPPQPSPGLPEEGAHTRRDDIIWALLSSDLAQEVKAEFNGQLSVGCDVGLATQHVFAQFGEALSDPNTGPVVILALAAMQLREGLLHPIIRTAALDLIESGEAAAAFPAQTGDLRKSRRQLLDQFASALESSGTLASE